MGQYNSRHVIKHVTLKFEINAYFFFFLLGLSARVTSIVYLSMCFFLSKLKYIKRNF